MALEGPCFPLGVDGKQLEEILSSLVRGKGWESFSLESVSLSLVPYWFFNYNAFVESSQEGSENSDKIVSEELSGSSSIDAVKGKFSEQIGLLSSGFKPVKLEKLGLKEKYSVVRPVISDSEAHKLSELKTSRALELSKGSVVVSGVRLYYVPVYEVSFSCEAGSFSARMEGVSGGFISNDSVPFKEASRQELARESFSEFFYPRTWAHYFVLMLKRVLSLFLLLPWTSLWFWIMILVLVLIYLILFL